MTNHNNIERTAGHRFWYFFPIQLLILHFKKNHFLIVLWLILLAITTGRLASRFGVPQQFLIPEYLGETGFLSFFIVGFALGGFIIAFNLYTYILHGFRFPFIATVSRPFQKFSINNFILPAIFLITYIIYSCIFQSTRELISPAGVVVNISGLILGISLFIAIAFTYFWYTNKNAEAFSKKRGRRKKRKSDNAGVDGGIHNPEPWFNSKKKIESWYVDSYMFHFWKISLARESSHYSRPVLDKVLAQNHINASRFEIALVVSFIIMGTFRENDFFIVPAAASALLFFTIMLMVASALFSWIKGWTTTVLIISALAFNFFYSQLRTIAYENKAYGLNYDNEPAQYFFGFNQSDSATVQSDLEHTRTILENWKIRASKYSEKPKLVIMNCSGGGSRSAFWTISSLMHADSALHGKLFGQTFLMTGASGGMLGSAYLREIKLREASGEIVSPGDSLYEEDMSKDLLNPIMQSIATNDWFIRFRQLEDGPYSYSKDRGYAFERQFNNNTRGLMNRRLRDYADAEQKAIIPMMVLTPTIVNDGRRLIIASQPVSYLSEPNRVNGETNPRSEDIEFSRLFAAQDAGNLRFTSALRMSATFPYILPMVSLPSVPHMEVMDAGIRDNFGLKTTLQFLYFFREWIDENTSGVVIIQVRDLPKGINLEGDDESLIGEFAAPIGSIYGNMTKTQDYNSEQMLRYLAGSFEQNIDLITFQLPLTEDNFVSLSWHLTEAEKRTIRNATGDEHFLTELNRLEKLLGHETLVNAGGTAEVKVR